MASTIRLVARHVRRRSTAAKRRVTLYIWLGAALGLAFAVGWTLPERWSVRLFDRSEDSTTLLTGRATIVDGDTIEVGGRRIRLFGIDAPELKQSCLRGNKPWPCGRQAADALANWLAGRPVDCVGVTTDKYNRIVARCSAGNEDIGGWMTENGWARAYVYYSSDYSGAELTARDQKVGIWSGAHDAPWDWRQRNPR